MLLPITSLGPIRFLGGTTDALRWAYCTGRCCCQLHQLGPSDFWEALPMHLDGPIALADAAADYINWAHQISGRHCRCIRMGPLHWLMLLLITLLWPIRCCCQLLHFGPLHFWEALLMHSDGPIALADAAADYIDWAHQISGRHCQCTW